MIENDSFSQEEVEQFDKLVMKDFSLQDDDPIQGFQDNKQLRDKLKIVIAYLLQHDFHRLVNAMYRLDVKESYFHEAMNLDDPEQIVDRIADIVFEREYQKVQTRIFYKKKK